MINMPDVPIKIISRDFLLLGEIDNYESLQFTRRFYSVGGFEIHINVNKQNVGFLKKDNIIFLANNPKKCGVIQYIENNNNELVVMGKTLQGIMQDRLTVPSKSESGDIQAWDVVRDKPAETIMKHYVTNNFINPEDPKRKISIINAPDKEKGIVTLWRARYEPVDTVLESIGRYAGLGWEVYLDIQNKIFVFDVMEGRDLTAGQYLLPPVIFSHDMDNCLNQKYVMDYLNEKNVGYAGGQGEEEDRFIQKVGNDAEGLDRKEVFLDCGSAEDIDELLTEGESKLKELEAKETIDAQIINRPFIYEKDWNLGDIVTVQNKKNNVTLNTRITEIKEIYERDRRLEIVFGSNIPGIIEIIQKGDRRTVK